MAEFSRRKAEFDEHDAVLLGISGDSVESHKAFADDQCYPFNLLADTDNAVRRDYKATDITGLLPARVTYVIGREGKIAGYCNSAIDMKLHAARAL
ncbi:peroxiredoxin family protein, partial [bacterium]|nr:peroxiredoxin family protein [bacterium]